MNTYTYRNGSMNAHRTSEVFEAMEEHYGMAAMCADEFDYEEAAFSAGFIHAVKQGRIPVLGSHLEFHDGRAQEYHHAILGDVCYTIYFHEEE